MQKAGFAGPWEPATLKRPRREPALPVTRTHRLMERPKAQHGGVRMNNNNNNKLCICSLKNGSETVGKCLGSYNTVLGSNVFNKVSCLQILRLHNVMMILNLSYLKNQQHWCNSCPQCPSHQFPGCPTQCPGNVTLPFSAKQLQTTWSSPEQSQILRQALSTTLTINGNAISRRSILRLKLPTSSRNFKLNRTTKDTIF